MDSRKTISDEISAISERVAAIGYSVPFSPPPAGYFENLAATVLLRIKIREVADEQDGLSLLLQNIDKNSIYSIPKGYFEALPDRVMNLIHAENAGNSNAAEELERLSPVLGKIGKQMPFSIPLGYFESLPTGISATLSEPANEVDSVLLSSMSKQNVYEVPVNYFSDLPSLLLKKINTKQAKVVSMGSVRKMMTYAAAVVAGALIIGGLFYFNGSNSENTGLALNPVLTTPGIPAAIQNLSDSDIVSYLETQNLPLPDDTFAAVADMNSDDMLEMLSDVPDETLRQYLSLYSDTKESRVN